MTFQTHSLRSFIEKTCASNLSGLAKYKNLRDFTLKFNGESFLDIFVWQEWDREIQLL